MDATHFWTAFFASLPALLAALAAFIKSIQNGEVAKNTANKVEDVHRDINSRLTELVEATRAKAHSEGMAEGIIQEQKRDKKGNP